MGSCGNESALKIGVDASDQMDQRGTPLRSPLNPY
jgi:hypothetical protein